MMVSRLLNAEQVAEILGVSRSSAYREMVRMSHVVLGERILRVSEKALERYLLNRTEVQCVVSTKKAKTVPSTGSTSTLAENVSRSVPNAGTNGQPSPPSDDWSDRPRLRPVFPRTRPRTRFPKPCST